MLKTVLGNKSINFQCWSNINFTGRYCNQNKYNLLIYGGYDERLDETSSNVKQIDVNDLNNVKDLNPMNKWISGSEAVCLKGELYVFGSCEL